MRLGQIMGRYDASMSDTPPWQTELGNLKRVLELLDNAVGLAQSRTLNHVEILGLIKAFDLCYKLAWRALRDLLRNTNPTMRGSRDVFRVALHYGLLEDGDMWMKMVDSRSRTMYVYDESVARDLSRAIASDYLPLLKDLVEFLRDL